MRARENNTRAMVVVMVVVPRPGHYLNELCAHLVMFFGMFVFVCECVWYSKFVLIAIKFM